MEKVEIDHKYGKFWFDENDIFNFKYREGVVIDLEAAKFISSERKKLFEGKRYAILVDGRDLKSILPPASKYFSSKENTELFTASAFLVGSALSRFFGNYYLKFFPPNIPTALFTNKEKAIEWLLQYKNI